MKGVKRKLDEVVPNLPKTNESFSPNFDAPSPSSTGSDLELPDAYHARGKTVEPQSTQKRPKEKSSFMNMDLDSRITSFLAAGSQGMPVIQFIAINLR